MIKYVFNIIAVILTLATWIYVYSIKDKRKAMLKVIYVGISSLYLVIQMYLYFKVCRYFPEELEKYSYALQGLCLGGFLVVMLIYTLSNRYIARIQKKEDESIRNFSKIRKELEESMIIIEDNEIRKQIAYLCEKARCMDPVCYGVEQEEEQILELIGELKRTVSNETAQKICGQIDKLFKLRKIRADKR